MTWSSSLHLELAGCPLLLLLLLYHFCQLNNLTTKNILLFASSSVP